MRCSALCVWALALLLGWTSVGAAQTATAPAPEKPAPATEKPAPDKTAAPKKVPDFEQSIVEFEKKDQEQPPAAGGIVFIGSSSIRYWKLNQFFPELPVLNRGFGGSHMEHAVKYAERIVIPYQPKTVVLYAGDNDLAFGKSPETVVNDTAAFVAKVRKALPETRVLVLTVKPSPKRWSLWPKYQETNKLLAAQFASTDQVKVVDVGTCLLDENGLPRDDFYQTDKLHLSPGGYTAWTSVVKPLLEEPRSK